MTLPTIAGIRFSRGSFTLRCDEWIWGTGLTVVVGLNGAGKSTLLHLLTGRLTPSHGPLVKGDFVLLPQDAVLLGRWRVADFLTYVAKIRGVPAKDRSGRVDAVLTRTGLQSKREAATGELSGGWAQRVLIAQCLLGQAQALVLDEPTASLDVAAAREAWVLLRELAQEATIVVSTHDAGAALEFADHLVPLCDGVVGAARDAAEMRARQSSSGLSPSAFLLEVMAS